MGHENCCDYAACDYVIFFSNVLRRLEITCHSLNRIAGNTYSTCLCLKLKKETSSTRKT